MKSYESTPTLIVTVMSTKGGVTKSTNVANIAAFCADCGIRTLMIDTDVQPTLSSYYRLHYTAPAGLFEFLIQQNSDPSQIISKTEFPNLDIIQSNDPYDTISVHLSNAANGMIRFNHLLKKIKGYDLIIIDTRGTRDITVNMAMIASHLILSPIKPEFVSAREFLRGTIGLYQELESFTELGFQLPPIKVVINCFNRTNDARQVLDNLHQIMNQQKDIQIELLDMCIPDRVAYREAASLSLPIHRYSRKESQNIYQLCCLLFPQWQTLFHAFMEGGKKHD